MNLLITGAGGQLGEELIDVLREDHEVMGLLHDELDITDRERVQKAFKEVQPDAVVNAAAYTDVDGAEENPQQAFSVNAVGVKHLVEAAREHDARIVHISTDYVFGGDKHEPYTTDDCPDPINTYGTSKLAGEQFSLSYDRGTVLRTSGVYGGEPGKHDNFVNTVLRLAKEQDELTIVDDQVLSPTWTRPIAEATGDILSQSTSGLFHFTSEGQCSWYEFASEIFSILGRPVQVHPVSSSKYDTKAIRPRFSALKNHPITSSLVPRSWKEGLESFLRREKLTT